MSLNRALEVKPRTCYHILFPSILSFSQLLLTEFSTPKEKKISHGYLRKPTPSISPMSFIINQRCILKWYIVTSTHMFTLE